MPKFFRFPKCLVSTSLKRKAMGLQVEGIVDMYGTKAFYEGFQGKRDQWQNHCQRSSHINSILFYTSKRFYSLCSRVHEDITFMCLKFGYAFLY